MSNSEKKNLELKRLIFFSNAIMAIAITLLALRLKINIPASQRITFSDLLHPENIFCLYFPL